MALKQVNMNDVTRAKVESAQYVKLPPEPVRNSLSTTIITLVVFEAFCVGLVTDLWVVYEIAQKLF